MKLIVEIDINPDDPRRESQLRHVIENQLLDALHHGSISRPNDGYTVRALTVRRSTR